MKATQFQTSLFGATGYVYLDMDSGVDLNMSDEDLRLSILLELSILNLKLTNPDIIFTPGSARLTRILTQLRPITTSKEITAYKLRDSFARTQLLEKYTKVEYVTIIAQYAITYGWSAEYARLMGISPVETLKQYASGFDLTTVVKTPNNVKEITIVDNKSLVPYFITMLESPAPLRLQQKELLEQMPKRLVGYLKPKCKVQATEAILLNMRHKSGCTVTFNSPTMLMRFILTNFQQGDNGEDYSSQITNAMLKTFKFHLPTKVKKLILQYFNDRKNTKWVVEQLLTNEQWWKRCLHHSHWTSAKKEAVRYPDLKPKLELLYSSDHSWTFNSRYSEAMKAGDFAEATTVLQERPGLLLRNLVNLLKYPTGAPLASKSESINTTDILIGSTKKAISDITEFLVGDFTNFLEEHKPAIKTAWQLLEELKNPKHQSPISVRTVQGVEVRYSTPIPPLDKPMTKVAKTAIKNYIKSTKKEQNKSLGKVYLSPTLADIAVQYSGNESNDNQVSGRFLPPGSTIRIPKDAEFIRLGVAWGGPNSKGSCDIDLSTMVYSNNHIDECYYGHPELYVHKNHKKELLAVSSGDITTCNKQIHSAEFIDIDVAAAKRSGITKFISTLHNYSGGSLAGYDTHLFISFIKGAGRVLPGNKLDIDLSRQDYATKLNDPVGAYIGAHLDIEEGTCTFISKPMEGGRCSNIVNTQSQIAEVLEALPQRLKLDYILSKCIKKSQIVKHPVDADTVITIDNSGTLNVLVNGEDLNKIIF